MRKPLIAGNWKMFKTRQEAKEFLTELKPLCNDTSREVLLCVPFTALETAKKAVRGSKIKIGAQNMSWADEGAFTGDISAAMLLDIGVDYVIIGHSERRAMFGDTNQTVNNKLKQAIKNGLKPIVCVGETDAEKEAGKTQEVLYKQIIDGFDGLTEEEAAGTIVAYEPIWAIGTGKTATPELANNEIKFIRNKLGKRFSDKCANKIRILYGGSVKAANFASFMAMSDIDGGLVGGASLKAKEFAGIINYEKN
ncbi:triosephosphate isomerase [Holotrichia oblita]|nr:triosephosphate isomerase [Holotrichia oblita]